MSFVSMVVCTAEVTLAVRTSVPREDWDDCPRIAGCMGKFDLAPRCASGSCRVTGRSGMLLVVTGRHVIL